MKILFLVHRIPYPPDKGEKIRAFHELKFLGARHEVDLFCFADSDAEAAHRDALKPYCRRIYAEVRSQTKALAGAARSFLREEPLSCGFFFSQKFRGEIERALAADSYDVIFVYCSSMAQYVPWPCRTPVVMDYVDIDSAKWRQYAENSVPPIAWVYGREARKLAAYEEKWARLSSSVIVSTRREAALLNGLGIAPLQVVSNGVEIPAPNQEELPENIRRLQPFALFVGTMDYRPNVDAVEYFSQEVLPNIHRTHPELKFAIVGRNPTARVRRLASKRGVVVTGGVPSVEAYLHGCAAVVAPFRIAQGIQNKLLEALAAGKPIVSTSGPAAAICAKHGETLLIADTVDGFTKCVVALLEDPALRYRFGNGVEFVRRNFSWHENLSFLEQLLLQAATSTPATAR
jgi:sugar transferase (PEP-CTERM/EpsH1 system associated)